MTSILIAYPIDHASLILGTGRITMDCFLIDIFSADKLSTEVDNTVTFFIDAKMDNTFVNNIVNDLQSLSKQKILTTDQQVWGRSFMTCIFSGGPVSKCHIF